MACSFFPSTSRDQNPHPQRSRFSTLGPTHRVPRIPALCAVVGVGLLVLSLVSASLASAPHRDDATARDLRLGKGLYDQGMFERAIAPLERVRAGEASRDEREEALFLLGEAYRSLGRLDDAESRFGALLRLAPQSEWGELARLGRGEALVRLDRAAEAIPLLEPVAAAAPRRSGRAGTSGGAEGATEDLRPTAAYWLGEAHARLEQVDRAIAAWTRVARDFPAHPLAPYAAYNGALRERDRDRPSAGLTLLDTLPAETRAALDDDLADRWHLLAGELALAAGDPRRARGEYLAVRGASSRPAALAGAAWAAHSENDAATLRAVRETLADEFPRSPERSEIDILLGSVLADGGKLSEARQLLAPARRGARGAEATFWLAWAHRRAGESAEAGRLFASIEGEGEWALRGVLRAEEEFRKAEQWEASVEAARRFIATWRDDPRVPAVVAGAIESSYRAGADVRVLELADGFADQWPEDPRATAVAHYGAEAALRSGETERAVAMFARAWGGAGDDGGGEAGAGVSRSAIAARYAWALAEAGGPDAPRAIAALLPSLEGERAAEVGILLGRAWSERGDATRAAEAYRAAASADRDGPHGARARLELGIALADADDPASEEAAVAAYRAALAGDASDGVRARARIDLATLLARRGSDTEARREFIAYLEEFPDGHDRADAWLSLAYCHWRLDDADDAREALEALEHEGGRDTSDPAAKLRRVEALLLDGRIARAAGDARRARRVLREAVELDPFGERAPELLRTLARIAEEEGRTDDAVACLTYFIERFPDGEGADEVRYRLAWIQHSADGGDRDAAAAGFRRLVTEHPDSPFAADAHFRLGEIAYAAGNLDAARTSFTAAIDRDGESPVAERARYRIGWGYRKAQEWSAAARAFGDLAAKHPEGELAGEALYLAADSHERADETAPMRALLDRFLDRYPNHERAPAVKIRLAEALALEGSGHGTKAAAASERARWTRIRTLLDPLRTVTLEEPWHTRHRITLGRALVRLGEGDRAVPILTEALDEGGARAAEAQFEIGLAHRRAGDRDRAIEAFIHGPVLYPYQPWAVQSHLEAGRDLLVAGKKREAERVLKLAIEHDPDGNIAREAQRMLDGGNPQGSGDGEAF